MANGGWDLKSISSLQAAAKWVLKGSGAMLVVVIRPDDIAISADPMLAPKDSTEILENRMPEIHERLQLERTQAREAAERKRQRDVERAKARMR